jgi:AraC-like DNA-binding protein
LAGFLFCQIMLLLGGLASYRMSDYFYRYLPQFFYLSTVFFSLPAPFMFLYVRSLAYSNVNWKKTDFLHLIPFLILFSYVGFGYTFHSPETQRLILKQKTLFSNPLFWRIYPVAMMIQFLSYNLASLHVLRRYQKQLKNEYSSIHRINLSWLQLILYCFIAGWLSDVARYFINQFAVRLPFDYGPIPLIAFFIFFNIIFYRGWTQPQVFTCFEEKAKYQTSNLTKEEAERYLKQIADHMERQKPFLKMELTLKDLSEELGIPHRHLSQILNENLNQNFYDFIGRYRIEESKRMLLESGATRKTVLEIIYEVGFNSKSSFNAAFKKYTGVTPSQFKKSVISA